MRVCVCARAESIAVAKSVFDNQPEASVYYAWIGSACCHRTRRSHSLDIVRLLHCTTGGWRSWMRILTGGWPEERRHPRGHGYKLPEKQKWKETPSLSWPSDDCVAFHPCSTKAAAVVWLPVDHKAELQGDTQAKLQRKCFVFPCFSQFKRVVMVSWQAIRVKEAHCVVRTFSSSSSRVCPHYSSGYQPLSDVTKGTASSWFWLNTNLNFVNMQRADLFF